MWASIDSESSRCPQPHGHLSDASQQGGEEEGNGGDGEDEGAALGGGGGDGDGGDVGVDVVDCPTQLIYICMLSNKKRHRGVLFYF